MVGSEDLSVACAGLAWERGSPFLTMSRSRSQIVGCPNGTQNHSKRLVNKRRSATLVFEMKLPNGERAIVDHQKLEGYCLSPHHPRGRNKARVFASVGIGPAAPAVLRDALLAAARNAEARPGVVNPYGQRHIVDFDMVHQA